MKKVTVLCVLLLAGGWPASAALAADVKADIHAAIAKGAAFLKAAQHKDGGWGARGSDVGITGLALDALARAPKDIRQEYADVIDKGVKFLLSQRRDNGSIVNKDGMVANYRTTIAAAALAVIDPKKHKDTIDRAVKYTKGIQGKDPNDKARYGSMGYGSDKTKGDIINTDFALELMAKAGVKKGDEAYERAMVFLGRTQNLDDYAEAGVRTTNDGGGIYRAVRDVKGASKAGSIKLPNGMEVPRSYGGATYCLLKSLLFCGMRRDHPRVQAAYNWIRDHYTVTEHPELGKQGLYYFYYTMARTLELWDAGRKPAERGTIKKGNRVHRWAEELGAQIASLQAKDGSWVNAHDRWWEGDPALVTAYGLLSLNICNQSMGG